MFRRYFTPHHIEGIGTFQDGGLWRNNPIDIAISEARALWPTIAEPDLVLSLGTGYQADEDASTSEESPLEYQSVPASPNTFDRGEAATAPAIEDVQQPRGLWRSGFITRCLESFLSTMDGQKFYDLPNQWNRACSEFTQRYFRLNIQLQGKTPALDDISNISPLKREARKQQMKNESLHELVECFIATLFYFELTSRPVRNRGHISCQGYIRCVICPGQGQRGTALEEFLNALTENGSKFYLSHRPISGAINSHKNIDPVTNRFRIKAEVQVRELDSAFPICLRLGYSKQPINGGRNISASPFTLDGLLEAQGWKNPFGRADHAPNEPDDVVNMKVPKEVKKRCRELSTHSNKRRRLDIPRGRNRMEFKATNSALDVRR
jgi:hypothetical protein